MIAISFIFTEKTRNVSSSFISLTDTHTQHTYTYPHTVSQHFWCRNLLAKCQMSSGASGPMFFVHDGWKCTRGGNLQGCGRGGNLHCCAMGVSCLLGIEPHYPAWQVGIPIPAPHVFSVYFVTNEHTNSWPFCLIEQGTQIPKILPGNWRFCIHQICLDLSVGRQCAQLFSL